MLLYADENFPLRVVEELRRLGHDVLTALDDGKANQAISDIDLLRRATEVDRVLLTLNRQDSNDCISRILVTLESSSARRILIDSDKRNELLRL